MDANLPDVLIIGDVDRAHFTTGQLQDLQDFVVVRGGTLITIAGPHHMPSAYSSTPLSRVIPLKRFGTPHTTVLPSPPPEGTAPGPARTLGAQVSSHDPIVTVPSPRITPQ